ncbi:hypothetical protein [Mycolicibacterium helvum]|nr:hypothetical protein [Mycolicibacterium helvum]
MRPLDDWADLELVVSAKAMGAAAIIVPTPNATASTPKRPM